MEPLALKVERLLTGFALILMLAGCHRTEVTSYTIPKEKDAESAAPTAPDTANPAATPGGMAGGGAMSGSVPVAGGSGLVWDAPKEWTPEPPAPMRKASFAISGADGRAELTITAFPGSVGGELANVNRWRGQMQLAPISQQELESQVTRSEQNGLQIAMVDLAGSSQRMLGAIVPFGGDTWFFKLTGPSGAVGAQKPVFSAFLHSLKPATAPTP